VPFEGFDNKTFVQGIKALKKWAWLGVIRLKDRKIEIAVFSKR